MTTGLPNGAYEFLRRRILSGELPPQSRIKEQEVAAQLGISRTPVREALARLKTEGLIDSSPRRGAVVSRIELDEIDEIYEIRAALERLVAKRACERATEHEIEEMERELQIAEGELASGDRLAAGTLNRELALEFQEDTRGFICCFDSREKMKHVLERLKEEDIGISIVVSGLIEDVKEMAKEVGLKPHTINLSMGIWGKTELLPGPDVLEFGTMCGHGLVPTKLVKKAVAAVAAGTMTPEEGAAMVGKPCICGIVNLTRAAKMLKNEGAEA